MRQTLPKWISMLLALAVCLSLTACLDSGGEDSVLSFQNARSYTTEPVPLPVETGAFLDACFGTDCLYLLTAGTGGEAAALYRVPLGGGASEVLSSFVPDGLIQDLFPGGDGTLWAWEQDSAGACRVRQLDPGTGRELRSVDLGALLEDMGIPEELLSLTVDGQGIVYAATDRKLRVLDGEGTLLFTLTAPAPEGAGGTLALLPDGTAAALVESLEGGWEIRSVDTAARDWGESRYSVPDSVIEIYSGSGPYQFFCQRGGAVYGRPADETLDERLFRWEDIGLGLAPDAACFALLEDGRAAVLTRERPDGAGDFRLDLRLAAPSDQSPSDGKIRLVYGAIGDDGWARTRVNRFNESSGRYYIELRDYAEGMLDRTRADFIQIRDAALVRLMADLTSGNAPDILDDRQIPLTALARQGMLVDLWPYIENDPELGREGVMDHVLECAETDGKLCRVFSTFRIDTLAAGAERAQAGWTPEEMQAAYGGTLPSICTVITTGLPVPLMYPAGSESLLYDLLRMDLDRYVDWASGMCSFDSAEFRDVLRLCAGANGGTEAGPTAFWNGEAVVCCRTIASLEDLVVDDLIFGGPAVLEDYEEQMAANGVTAYPVETDGGWTGITDQELRTVADAREAGQYFGYPLATGLVTGTPAHDGFAAYPGFPVGSGSGSCFRVSDCLAITESCAEKEGAWSFVRQLLLPDGNLASLQNSLNSGLMSSNFGFPVNRADFEDAEPAWVLDEAGEYLLDGNGERVEGARSTVGLGVAEAINVVAYLRVPGPEYREKLLELYASTDHILDGDNEQLLDIIRELAQPYFAGDKPLDETVDLIQRAAVLYVNERRSSNWSGS